jgi:hypothetical protein
MGLVCGGAAVALEISPVVVFAAIALAAVVRVLAGDSPAALTGAVLAPILAVASFAEAGGELGRAAIALAAAGWTVTELARLPGEPASPLVAVLPATVAAILDPSFAALVAIAGVRLVIPQGFPRARESRGPHPASDRLPSVIPRGFPRARESRGPAPWQRSRWVWAVPGAGVLAIVLAVLAGTAWPALGAPWFGAAAHPVSVARLAGLAGATLGPLTAVAALAGIPALARPRYAELAVAAAIAGAILVDLRAGTFGPTSIGLAALLSGLAIGRLAAMIRIPSGQVIAGATAGVLVVIPPTWTALAHRPASPHIGHASR